MEADNEWGSRLDRQREGGEVMEIKKTKKGISIHLDEAEKVKLVRELIGASLTSLKGEILQRIEMIDRDIKAKVFANLTEG